MKKMYLQFILIFLQSIKEQNKKDIIKNGIKI